MSIRKPPATEPRIETGVTAFGDDWPGVFIRGDNAMNFALHLEALLQWIDTPEKARLSSAVALPVSLSVVRGLLNTLKASNING